MCAGNGGSSLFPAARHTQRRLRSFGSPTAQPSRGSAPHQGPGLLSDENNAGALDRFVTRTPRESVQRPVPEVGFGSEPHSPRSPPPPPQSAEKRKTPPEANAPPAIRRRHDSARDRGAPLDQVIHHWTPADFRRRARAPVYTMNDVAVVVVQWVQRRTGVREDSEAARRYQCLRAPGQIDVMDFSGM